MSADPSGRVLHVMPRFIYKNIRERRNMGEDKADIKSKCKA
jgi:hypothetical protein